MAPVCNASMEEDLRDTTDPMPFFFVFLSLKSRGLPYMRYDDLEACWESCSIRIDNVAVDDIQHS